MKTNPVIQAAEEYLTQSARYLSMRQLGQLLGVSSHVVGRKLKESGLRTAEGKPSTMAIEGGYTRKAVMHGHFLLDVWHEEKTLHVLRPLIEQQEK